MTELFIEWGFNLVTGVGKIAPYLMKVVTPRGLDSLAEAKLETLLHRNQLLCVRGHYSATGTGDESVRYATMLALRSLCPSVTGAEKGTVRYMTGS